MSASQKKKSGSEKRVRGCIIRLRAKTEERQEMQANAAAADLSLSSYLRSLAMASPRTRPVRRPSPDAKLLAQAMGRLGIYASNAHQLLKLANRGEVVYVQDLAEASKKLHAAADELLKFLKG
jgi:hypothetical protein